MARVAVRATLARGSTTVCCGLKAILQTVQAAHTRAIPTHVARAVAIRRARRSDRTRNANTLTDRASAVCRRLDIVLDTIRAANRGLFPSRQRTTKRSATIALPSHAIAIAGTG